MHRFPQEYKDCTNLPRTLAVFYETLRLHPAVTIIPKVSIEETFLPDDPLPGDDRKRKVYIPKGSNVDIDVVGLHRHPGSWKDPELFNPERFLGDYDKDAFVPFSTGARGCIGRRFAEVGAVAILAVLVKYFKFSPAPVESGKQETHEQTKERLLDAERGLTLTPVDVSLMFERRDNKGLRRPEWTE